MKREDVKNKITGITEEQPNWLMQENGSDITREKFLSTLSLRRATFLSLLVKLRTWKMQLSVIAGNRAL